MLSMFTGCQSKDTEPEEDVPATSDDAVEEELDEAKAVDITGADIATLQEAPMLSDMVTAGDLPKVEERLPIAADMMIEPVFDAIGKYGGDLHFPWRGSKDKWTLEKITEEALFRFKQDGSGIEPNVAKGYQVNDDATVYTIYLREGMKWSDGVPFTADDVIFYYHEMVLKETFGKSVYNCYYSVDPETGDKALAEVTKVDDYTFRVIHKYPSVMFLERLAIDNKWLFAPKHYHEQLLPHIVGEDTALAKAKELGYEDIKTLGKQTGYYYWIEVNRPTLRPWIIQNDPDDSRTVFERNPYYFKVDEEGKQLPYIDRIVCDKVESKDHFILEGIAGNIDIRGYDFTEFTLLMENKDAGDYRITKWSSSDWTSIGIVLNQTVEDEKLRKVFQDVRFREALSVAVDRAELTELITDGLAVPQQASIPEGLKYYREGWADQWNTYNVARANELLDDMGLPMNERTGFRTYADGSDFTFILYHSTKQSEGQAEELLKMYYEAVGIKTNVKAVDETLYEELKLNNGLEGVSQKVGSFDLILRPDSLVPVTINSPLFGQYASYVASNGEQGIAPEGDIATLVEHWDKIASSTKKEVALEYAEKIIDLHQKNQWYIGYASPNPLVLLVKNDLKNVPNTLLYNDPFRGYGHAKPVQFYFDR